MVKYTCLTLSLALGLGISSPRPRLGTVEKYYLIVVDHQRYNAVTNAIKSDISYFALLSKEANDNYTAIIKRINSIGEDNHANMNWKKEFKVAQLFFPIYDENKPDFFQIDTSLYNNLKLPIDDNVKKAKGNMLYNKLFSVLHDMNICERLDQNIYRIMELEGHLSQLNGKILKMHLARNKEALNKIAEDNSGKHSFKTILGDSNNTSAVSSKESFSDCVVLFSNIKSYTSSVIDFQSRTVRDTVLYFKK